MDVAVDNSGKVIGASLYSYAEAANLIMYNIVAVNKEHRHKGVATALISRMVGCAAKRARELGRENVDFIMGEIEQPDLSFKGEEGRLRNLVRPAFHDKISRLRAIRLQDGRPLVYLLPIMATEEERRQAIKAGEPLKPEPLMLCLRPTSRAESEGIGSREAAKLLTWFYKDYLEAECSDVRKDEVNELLAIALAKLAPGAKPATFRKLLEAGHRDRLLAAIPEMRLSFMKVSEAGA